MVGTFAIDASGNITGTCKPAPVIPVTPSAVPWADPSTVLVVYQTNSGPELGTGGVNSSLFVAQHYMAARKIPAANLVGISTYVDSCGGPGCPNGNLAHGDSTNLGSNNGGNGMPLFLSQIAVPILAALKAQPGKIKYIVPVYGVPVTIAGPSTISVDSAISALLLPTGGSVNWPNPYFSASPASAPPHIDTSTAGILLVSRLDGPTAMIAAGLVDSAIAGETAGVQGTAYFDYGPNNQLAASVLNAATVCNSLTPAQVIVLNDQSKTGGMIKSAPNCAWAWGGYAPYDDGALAKAYLFAKGAVAASMNSNSAQTIRRATPGAFVYWFLLNGVAATWGAVNEPFAGEYACGDNFLAHLWHGYTFGEAAYLACPTLNWMMVFVGDPLYRPILK